MIRRASALVRGLVLRVLSRRDRPGADTLDEIDMGWMSVTCPLCGYRFGIGEERFFMLQEEHPKGHIPCHGCHRFFDPEAAPPTGSDRTYVSESAIGWKDPTLTPEQAEFNALRDRLEATQRSRG